ncbi:hypothetical protein [Emticicia fluvialis]|uniref:hypothetical protein n=1 Tax=Emticicia fluvialis TaxID=2974474 RepID=UPI00216622F2|nr:hypothetical protein [Emticicia fluvialis]
MDKHLSKRLIYVGFVFRHHKGTHAGYDKIKNYLKYDLEVDSQAEHEWLSYSLSNIGSKIIRKLYMIVFGSTYLLTLIKCFYLILFRKNQVFHFVYGENNYKWLHRFKGETNEIVCTYHQPLEFFVDKPALINTIKCLDKIILMSEKEVSAFKEWTGRDNVFFIPHGIDIDFYSPDYSLKREKTILMVGNWLRDFKLANEVFNILLEKVPDLNVIVVTSKDNHYHFNNSKIQLLSGITDEELRNLYRTVNCMFLPLLSFTANNAVLEAASAGCPILIATNNFNNSYFETEQIELMPLETGKIVERLINSIDTPYDQSKASKIREFVSDKYSWNKIANETKALLIAD